MAAYRVMGPSVRVDDSDIYQARPRPNMVTMAIVGGVGVATLVFLVVLLRRGY
jgi:hypothetical protein